MANAQEEYDRIIRPLEETMVRTIWRIVRDPDDAEDVLQNSLARIWARWNQVLGHPNPRALVLRICINCAWDLLRKRVRQRRRQQPDDVLAELADRTPDAQQQLEQRERQEQITTALACLSSKQATAVLMRLIDGQPHAIVAEALGCSPATARVHYARGCRHLSVQLRHLLADDEQEKRHEPCQQIR